MARVSPGLPHPHRQKPEDDARNPAMLMAA
jgi:hypothetical protein